MKQAQFIDLVLKKATDAGLSDAEVFYTESRRFSVQVYKGEIDDYTATHQQGLSLRVQQGGRTSYAFTEAFDEAAVDTIVSAAKENLDILDADDVPELFAGEKEYPAVKPAQGVDPSGEEKIELAKQIERIAREADPDVIDVLMTTVSTSEGTQRIKNTRGLDVSHTSANAVSYLEVLAKNGDRTSAGFAFRLGAFADFDAAELAREAVEDALAYRGAKSVASGAMRVAFRPLAFADLIEVFDSIFSAESAQKGMSLLRGRVGETIAAPIVSLIDDPLMEGGIDSAPFDAEGVATRTKNVVDKGVLTTLLHSRKTAQKDGVSSTGNASKGSYAAPVGISAVQFHLAPGECDDVLADMDSGVLISEMQGMHSGANAASGDFSLAAKGFLVENGKIVRPVDGITVAGNFYQVLKDIKAVGKDLRFNTSLVGSPSVWVQSLTIGGE